MGTIESLPENLVELALKMMKELNTGEKEKIELGRCSQSDNLIVLRMVRSGEIPESELKDYQYSGTTKALEVAKNNDVSLGKIEFDPWRATQGNNVQVMTYFDFTIYTWKQKED